MLQKYSRQLNAVEINSSFYRIHKPETYQKWAAQVPDDFRFAVKLFRYFTQEKRLKESGSQLLDNLEGISRLGRKWSVLLVQLPPSLDFNRGAAEKFLRAIRGVYAGTLVWEPRHRSWATDDALDLLADFNVSKVRAHPDPCYVTRARRQRVESAIYYRLHGKPEIYRSNYEDEKLLQLRHRLVEEQSKNKQVWCIFDNTTFGYATENAFALKSDLGVFKNKALRPETDCGNRAI